MKKAYDEAEGIPKVDNTELEKEIMMSETWDYNLKKKQAELRLKKLKQHDIEDSDEENESENLKIKTEFISKLKESTKALDKAASEFLEEAEKNKENMKETEYINADGSVKNPPPINPNVKWIEREENPDLIETLRKNNEEWLQKMKNELKEGDEVLNLSPFNVKDGNGGELNDSGVYVLKDGKLVKGEGRKREEVMFSNWYWSNADPEDIKRHWELMDRFCYKGPKWDGIGIPKSIIEEENPVYRNVPKEVHPKDRPDAEETWGKKDFEYVVR